MAIVRTASLFLVLASLKSYVALVALGAMFGGVIYASVRAFV
jgi:hypothetical protein